MVRAIRARAAVQQHSRAPAQPQSPDAIRARSARPDYKRAIDPMSSRKASATSDDTVARVSAIAAR